MEKFNNFIRSLSLPSFCRVASGFLWQSRPHLLVICDAIYKLFNSDKEVLIVNMPPRHGKSELISKYFPAWFLLNNPDKRLIFTTYSDRFAELFGRYNQDLFLYFMRYFNCNIYQRKQSASEWLTSLGGSMVSTGAGGSLTGRGADCIVIDDPIKNVSEALSSVFKENLKDWLFSTVLTRLEPGGKLILVCTRWQPDDISGYLISNTPSDKIIHLNMKALATTPDFFRNVNDALWEERYSRAELERLRERITVYWFNAMYQQDPSARHSDLINISKLEFFVDTGDFFVCTDKNLSFPKRDCYRFATCDLGISEKAKADFTVVIVFSIDIHSNVFIERVFREHFPADQHEEKIKQIYFDYGLISIGIESVAYQETLIKRLLSQGISVVRLVPERDKRIRVLTMVPHLNAGKIFVKSGQTWEKDFFEELSLFPIASHDDQVDAFSYINTFFSYTQSRSVFVPSDNSKHNLSFY